MLALKIALAFVCLCSFGAAFPDVFPGCSFLKYFCTARECTSAFYKSLHQDPSADCGKRFEAMLTCLKLNTFRCAGRRQMVMIWLTVHIPKIFKKEEFCGDANFDIPQNDNVSCSRAYFEKAPLCGKTIRQKFATDRSDSSLCSESAKAKKCVKDLLASECTLDAETMEINNLTLSDHNPFCSTNRDPEATGLEVCHDFTLSSTQAPRIPVLTKTPTPKSRRKGGRKRTCNCPCKRSRSRKRLRPTRPVTRP